jgi:CheY-like chemotaxis protein
LKPLDESAHRVSRFRLAASASIEIHQVDVILAGLHMPGKDGYSFVNEHRARRPRGASTPVIAVSADAPGLINPGPSILFVDYLLKPVRYASAYCVSQRVNKSLTQTLRTIPPARSPLY